MKNILVTVLANRRCKGIRIFNLYKTMGLQKFFSSLVGTFPNAGLKIASEY